MHLYWRVIEELKYLGEIWVIRDPSISRRYKQWVNRHFEYINLNFEAGTKGFFQIPYSLN